MEIHDGIVDCVGSGGNPETCGYREEVGQDFVRSLESGGAD